MVWMTSRSCWYRDNSWSAVCLVLGMVEEDCVCDLVVTMSTDGLGKCQAGGAQYWPPVVGTAGVGDLCLQSSTSISGSTVCQHVTSYRN